MERLCQPFQPTTRLTEQLADYLTEAIVSGRMVPGQPIRELCLAQEAGVSRGSVREALLVLERRHLIEIVPRKGATVADFSRRQHEDLYDLLEMLYTHIGQRMAELWDEEDQPIFEQYVAAMEAAALAGDSDGFADAMEQFWETVLSMVRNRYLGAVMDSLRPASRWALHRLGELDKSALETSVNHWRQFPGAMAARDREAVRRVVEELFRSWRSLLNEALQP